MSFYTETTTDPLVLEGSETAMPVYGTAVHALLLDGRLNAGAGYWLPKLWEKAKNYKYYAFRYVMLEYFPSESHVERLAEPPANIIVYMCGTAKQERWAVQRTFYTKQYQRVEYSPEVTRKLKVREEHQRPIVGLTHPEDMGMVSVSIANSHPNVDYGTIKISYAVELHGEKKSKGRSRSNGKGMLTHEGLSEEAYEKLTNSKFLTEEANYDPNAYNYESGDNI